MNNNTPLPLQNPYRPGAGHTPPYLAGRVREIQTFKELLQQRIILNNLVITGLRGIGKTALLNTLQPTAISEGWLWTGTDSSESNSIDEATVAIRFLTDLSLLTSNIEIDEVQIRKIGFLPREEKKSIMLDYNVLMNIFENAPGLISDKLKRTIDFAWFHLSQKNVRGVIFAYDEAQTLSDHKSSNQYPLSLLLDTFQYLQKQEIPFMLILTGLPMLMANLVETRTYSERFFRVLELGPLSSDQSREAIEVPLVNFPIQFTEQSIKIIINQSGGYPYFIQYMCREAFDVFAQKTGDNEEPVVPIQAILTKLDVDFFSGRWAKATDRERELMLLFSELEGDSFRPKDLLSMYPKHPEITPFSPSQALQILTKLCKKGLIYKHDFGKYSFAVPMMKGFIQRNKIKLFSQ